MVALAAARLELFVYREVCGELCDEMEVRVACFDDFLCLSPPRVLGSSVLRYALEFHEC